MTTWLWLKLMYENGSLANGTKDKHMRNPSSSRQPPLSVAQIKPEELRRFWSMLPLTRETRLGIPFF